MSALESRCCIYFGLPLMKGNTINATNPYASGFYPRSTRRGKGFPFFVSSGIVVIILIDFAHERTHPTESPEIRGHRGEII